MKAVSPLRYPGGKGKLAEFFCKLFSTNSLNDGTYIEPYAGGASVGLQLLFNEHASKIIINDIDKSIFYFWDSVLNNTEKLCRKINDTKVTVEEWNRQKKIYLNSSKSSPIKIGFSTFFLNRTNRSGIINAGIIGGKAQAGNWKIDARFNKKDLINRIERIASYKNRIELFNLDAMLLLNNLKPKLNSNYLIYLDPPYFVKGKELYKNFYNFEDHKLIRDKISKISKCKWVITYDDVPEINELYSKFRTFKYKINYSVSNEKRKGKELMIIDNKIILPS